MRRIVISSIAALMLVGCGPAGADDPASDHGTYDIDAATGVITGSITTEEGNIQINSGVNIAADLPDGWTLYPGAEVQMATNASIADGKAVIMAFSSEDSPADIIAFYREQAEGNGIAIEATLLAGEGQMIGGAKDSGTGFSVLANQREDGKTLTNLTISDNYGGSAPATADAAAPSESAQ